jgi:predicted small lipoprotein YifL
MKAKLATLALCITILFVISACGYKGDQKPDSSDTANNKTTDVSVDKAVTTEAPKKDDNGTTTTKPKESYELITEALAKESGKSVNDFSLGIRQLTLTHFLGIISGQKGIILAAKQGDSWVIAFDGVFGPNKTYKCDDVKSYGFPTDMISDCK